MVQSCRSQNKLLSQAYTSLRSGADVYLETNREFIIYITYVTLSVICKVKCILVREVVHQIIDETIRCEINYEILFCSSKSWTIDGIVLPSSVDTLQPCCVPRSISQTVGETEEAVERF